MCFFEQKSVTDASTTVKGEIGFRPKNYLAGKASRHRAGNALQTKALSSFDLLASLWIAMMCSWFFIALNDLAIGAFRCRSAMVYFLSQVRSFYVLKWTSGKVASFAKVTH